MAAINMNQNLFDQTVNGEKPVLLDFWAPWCGYCRRIAPAYDQIAAQYTDTLVVGKVDVDQEPKLAERAQITVLPTLVLYRNGNAIDSIVAPESKAAIDAFIRKNLNL